MRALRIITGLALLSITGCHSERPEPSSAEATQGSDEPYFDTPDGTIGPNVGGNATAAPVGSGTLAPADIVGGTGGSGGSGGFGGSGGSSGSGGIGGTGGGGGM